MGNKLKPNTELNQQLVYQIRLENHLDCGWTDWFENCTITQENNGDTLLTCTVVDQPALYGLLRKVRDLGMPLISVTRVTPEQANKSGIHQSLKGEKQ